MISTEKSNYQVWEIKKQNYQLNIWQFLLKLKAQLRWEFFTKEGGALIRGGALIKGNTVYIFAYIYINFVYMCIYIYIYIYVYCVYIYPVYIYVYVQ